MNVNLIEYKRIVPFLNGICPNYADKSIKHYFREYCNLVG